MKGVGLRISTISLVNGLIKSIDNGVSKSDYAYNSRNLLTSETQTLASRPARVVAYDYDDDSLRKDLTYPSAQAIEYAWTARAQLQSVSAGVPPPLATYSYDKAGRNTALVHENGITESKTYDAASQLLANTHLKGSTAVSGHGYTLDTTGRRTAETFADGTTPSRSYGYDTADQVTAATYGSSQSDTYAYDAMGNRTTAAFSRSVGVPPTSGTVNYGTANSVNQYISVTGLTPISHDANGNLLQQNGVTYGWDSENRLLAVTPASPALGDQSLVHTYDGLQRRVTSTVKEWTTSGWQDLTTTLFIYDGWNVIEEYALNPLNSVLLRTRTWGGDLSDSMQGAGGVGGLLLTEEVSGSTTTAYHFAYDGNGNVTEITDLIGDPIANYRYDAFGNTLVATGSYAASNRYRFSTKPLDFEVTNAQLYYYGYRYYDPVTGRWPSRDPIEEAGGINMYGFVGNNGVNQIDILGNISPGELLALSGTVTRYSRSWWANKTGVASILINLAAALYDAYNLYLVEPPKCFCSENHQGRWEERQLSSAKKLITNVVTIAIQVGSFAGGPFVKIAVAVLGQIIPRVINAVIPDSMARAIARIDPLPPVEADCKDDPFM